VKDENCDLLSDSHNILNTRKKYLSQLLNVYRVSDIRQIKIHTAEPLVPDPSSFEVEIVTAKLERYKSPCSDQFWHNRFKQKVKHYGLISISSLILFGIRSLISGRSLLLYKFTRRAIKLTVVIIVEYHCY
jgi:hypothetical protein